MGTRILVSWPLLPVKSSVIGHCGVRERVSLSSPETEMSAHFKSALRFPQAHSPINIWKFSPCCICLSLSPWCLREGRWGSACFLSPRTVTPGNATDGFGLPRTKEPPNIVLLLVECLCSLFTCLKITL